SQFLLSLLQLLKCDLAVVGEIGDIQVLLQVVGYEALEPGLATEVAELGAELVAIERERSVREGPIRIRLIDSADPATNAANSAGDAATGDCRSLRGGVGDRGLLARAGHGAAVRRRPQ